MLKSSSDSEHSIWYPKEEALRYNSPIIQQQYQQSSNIADQQSQWDQLSMAMTLENLQSMFKDKLVASFRIPTHGSSQDSHNFLPTVKSSSLGSSISQLLPFLLSEWDMLLPIQTKTVPTPSLQLKPSIISEPISLSEFKTWHGVLIHLSPCSQPLLSELDMLDSSNSTSTLTQLSSAAASVQETADRFISISTDCQSQDMVEASQFLPPI